MIKQNKFRHVSQKFNLPQAMQEVYDLMSYKGQIKGLGIKFEQNYFGEGVISSLPLEVVGDKERLQQVMINLLTNSISNSFDSE